MIPIRRLSLQISIIGLAILNLSATSSGRGDFGILSQEDYEIEASQDSPALETAIGEEPHFESKNVWQCFWDSAPVFDCYEEKTGLPAADIDAEKRDEKGYWPTIIVSQSGSEHIFEAPGWADLEVCQRQLSEWQGLINAQRGFCTFAARLPFELDSDQDEVKNWVIYGLKSPAGRVLAPIYDPAISEDLDEDRTADISGAFANVADRN